MSAQRFNYKKLLKFWMKKLYYVFHTPYTRDFLPKHYKVGAHSFGKPTVLDWDGKSSLSIGKFCSIAPNVTIFLGGNHRTDWISTYPFPAFDLEWSNINSVFNFRISKGNTVIENDVWIGRGATILSGVTIGNGAVIGAFSVVTKNVSPYTIVAGVPAKVIRKRFTQRQINVLQKIKWWDWPKKKIDKNINILCSPDVSKLGKIR